MGGVSAGWTALLAACLVVAACQPRDSVTSEDAAMASDPIPATALQVPRSELLQLQITQPGKQATHLSISSGGWRTVTPLPYRANEPAMESILAVMADIEIRRRVAERPAPEHRLSMDSSIVVQAWTQQGARQPFAIGASTGEETYVQRVGEDAVYAVRGRCRRFFDLSFQQLRDPTVTKLDLATIEAVHYVNQHDEIKIVADPDNAGRFVEASPSIANFDHERATKNVAVLSALFAKDFLDAPIDKVATGLFSPETAQIAVSIRERSDPLTVYLGARATNGQLHLRTSASDQIYFVSAHLASSLLPQRKHFVRSDDEMRELNQQPQTRKASARTEAPTEAPEHKHGTKPPTQVPPELMSELRDLARQQGL